MILRLPDLVSLTCEGITSASSVCGDAKVNFDLSDSLKVTLTASETHPKYIRLRWNFTDCEKRAGVKILGAAYERGYGNLSWQNISAERIMPWYILVSNGSDRNPDLTGRFTEGFGVKVQPGAIVTWQYDDAGITMWADVRNGGSGVHLGGRELTVCEIVFGEYRDMTAFDAGRAFCRLMCPVTVSVDHPVYGSNNWYYAYGHSSHDEILADTEIVASQCAGLDNIPYMVIDDGWQKNNCDAPWTVTNERFHDMKALASEMASRGVRPGIWLRYLIDSRREIPEATEEWRLMRDQNYLDPSHPEVIDYVKRITSMLVDWGYTLIKHDYSTADIFGAWGFQMGPQMTKDGWNFHDRSRTSAEIVRDFYQAVKDAAGKDCVIIGCNTISHLCAGMYELNRTGDDTSGFDWNRTRKMGVNTLAMRLIQNGIFYMADADCVGITGAIDWSLNRQWLDVLGRTGSPLFVSCKPGVLNESEIAELRAAWAENSVQKNIARPLDWMENDYPSVWEIDGKEVRYNWYPIDGATNFNPKA